MEMDQKQFLNCLEGLSSQIHEVWVNENKDWAPEDQKVHYSKLPEFEKEKDREVARAVMDTITEFKSLNKLKDIEIESSFERLYENNPENIKRVSHNQNQTKTKEDNLKLAM
jgi:hypothetical protein